ncbi:E3 ubiquitin-protein ligase RNF181 [Amyelois transitella]|uniref:E3 ubiquitin-protein ligase RNF181 n=1 Tax=Amyelois transitella TaxID=680683 RepID=UPI00067AEC41|nr:E3 ubiquitin-protein ligase RNF181 [Amyelois transitella]XP_060802124.1 E3 ubiquitin-protein ligase RNF181 [Amyelois transitella]XP_060802125.1 E3 ubiquitin-protein ligase RNF181 [Amyelois transitella]
MAGYFEEMGWRELAEGEQPNHLLHMARFLIDFGMYEDNFSGEWPRLPPPASKEVVKNLPEVVIDDTSKNCPICLKNFCDGEKAKEMPCHHVFHPVCILTWLERTNSCPFCRFELGTDDEGYEAFKKEKKRAEQRKEDLDTLHNSMFS